jgi:hypothetical protein
MLNTFQNSATVLSIGVFFTVITLGLAAKLPGALDSGLTAQGVPAMQAHDIAQLPPIGSLFAAFLGYNPIQTLVGSDLLHQVGPQHAAYLTGRGFFPSLISGPFGHGLHLAFLMAAVCCFLGAVFSWLRGGSVPAPLGASSAEEVEVALAGAGEAAMAEVGAGGSRELVDEVTTVEGSAGSLRG